MAGGGVTAGDPGTVSADTLDVAAVRRWSRAAVDILAAHRAEIDALNVFPVPDGDTGRNMLLTFRAADDALTAKADARDTAEALAALSTGAARGAIGNSGFLLSQILRGLAETARPGHACDTRAVADGLRTGAHLARAAVVVPVEGTMLSVAGAAAAGAAAALGDSDEVERDGSEEGGAAAAPLADAVAAALAAADVALQRTPMQLAELGDAGVVDAGGRGLVLILAALAASVGAEARPLAQVRLPDRPVTGSAAAVARSAAEPATDVLMSGASHREAGADAGFEVQYLLDATEAAVRRLRQRLHEIGGSVAVVGTGPQAWKVHVHVDDVGPAIEAGVNAGHPHDISVVRLCEPGPHEIVAAGGPAARTVVALVPGRGLVGLLRREGVVVAAVRSPGKDAAGVIDAVPGDCREVILLAVDAAAATAEESAAALRRRGVRISVVPVRSPVQALAAVAVHDASRAFDDDVVAMAEAAGATRYAELCFADTAALTAVGLCQPGDVLGLIDGDVVEIGHSVLAVAIDVLDRLLGIGAELVTVLVGADAPPRTGPLLEAHVRRKAPFTDVVVYPAEELGSPVVIGAE